MRNVGEDGEEKYDKNKDVEEKKARKRSRREEMENKDKLETDRRIYKSNITPCNVQMV